MEEEILKQKSILVVDDEVDLRDIICTELEFLGAKVFQAQNIDRAKDLVQVEEIDLVVSDIRMAGGSGIDLLKWIKFRNNSYPSFILFTGFADITTEMAYNLGAEALIHKPFSLDDLIKDIERLSSPKEERFKMKFPLETKKNLHFNYSENLNESIDKKLISFGRGGMSLKLSGQIELMEGNGTPFTLDIKFKDIELKGQVVARWARYDEKSDVTHAGLEFLYLEEETLDYFLKQMQINPDCVPYISSI